MKNLSIKNIIECTNGVLFHGNKVQNLDFEVQGIVLDSRQIESGFCFVATVGERVDGHSFIKQVVEKGAKAVICETIPDDAKDLDVALIQVEDSFIALKMVAEFYRMQLSIPFIGITGSVGKTSTKEYIAGVLEQKYKVLKTQGNFNNEVGVPLTILRIRDEHEVAVVEMGINHFGEMTRLSKIVKPDVVVMTNIGQCHLEFLGDLKGVLKAKSEIFEYLATDGCVYINGDDETLQTVLEVKGKKPTRFGLGEENDFYSTKIEAKGLTGSQITIHMEDGSHIDASVSQPGEHMVRNAIVAAAVATKFGLTNDEIAKGIQSVVPVGGRSNVITCGRMTIIDDCYNANPVSVKTALKLLELADNKKIAILGDMFELGKDEEAMHKETGAVAAAMQIDELVCIGKLSFNMYEAACKEANKCDNNLLIKYYETVDDFLSEVDRDKLTDSDVTLLVKASHGMNFTRIVKALEL